MDSLVYNLRGEYEQGIYINDHRREGHYLEIEWI
jgi:hypothetical protein